MPAAIRRVSRLHCRVFAVIRLIHLRHLPLDFGAAQQLLLDHLVGVREHSRRNSDAERLRGLEVDDEIVLRCLLNWEIGGLLALEDTADVDPDLTVLIRKTSVIAQQTASF
jgi:hypothetical protein